MNNKSIVICGLLVICFVLCCVLQPVLRTSADEFDTPLEIENGLRYTYVDSASCTLSISSGTATVFSVVKGYEGTTSTSTNVYLEKLVNGSWQNYMSWTHSGGRKQNNTDSISVPHGAYRVWMSVTAGNAYGSESFNVDGNTCGW